MITRAYKIADKVIEVNSLYDKVHKYCTDYITNEKPDFSVVIQQTDINAEKQKSDSEYLCEGKMIPSFSDEELEVTAVYRKIAEIMPNFDTFVFHGSVIAVDGQAFLFTAKSGTGKSTHTRLWREMLGDKAIMVNDDKPMLKITNTGVIAYGTPYNGKHRLDTNISVPLKTLCILERAEKNQIQRITKKDIYSMLIQQVYRPQDPVQMAKTLKLIDQLAEKVELYRLGCNMDPSAAEVAYNVMKG